MGRTHTSEAILAVLHTAMPPPNTQRHATAARAAAETGSARLDVQLARLVGLLGQLDLDLQHLQVVLALQVDLDVLGIDLDVLADDGDQLALQLGQVVGLGRVAPRARAPG
jgi:hypothetical protein